MDWRGAQLKLHRGVVAFFGSLAHFAILEPKRVLLITVLVTLLAAPGLRLLHLRTDGHALVSPQAPETIYDRFIREKFGIQDQIVVLVHSLGAGGIFNKRTLQLVRELTADFAALPEIGASNVTSLATEPGLRPQHGTFMPRTLLEPEFSTKQELDQLRDDLQKIELYNGTLVSVDQASTAILVGVPSTGDRTRFYEQVLAIVTARKGQVPDEISITGPPVAEALLGIHILEDLGVPKRWLGGAAAVGRDSPTQKGHGSLRELKLLLARRIGLVPIAVIVMMAVFFLTFRNFLAMLLPLPEVAITLVFVFGLMGWLGVPVYLTTAVMPVLLTAMCVTDEIHVFSRYFALVRERGEDNHIELVRETVDEMVCPVVNTTLTTAVGFISFAFSPLRPVQAFGIFTGIGVLFSLFYSVTVVPAMLTQIKPGWLLSRSRKGGRGRLASWFPWLAAAIVRHRLWVIGALVLACALALPGLHRLVIQDSWIGGFAPGSEFRRATEQVNTRFEGMHQLLVALDAPDVLRGDAALAELKKGRLSFSTNLVPSQVLIEHSPVTISIMEGRSVPGGPDPPPTKVWHALIEDPVQYGDHIVAPLVQGNLPPNLARELSNAVSARFEVVIHNQLKPEVLARVAALAAFIRERKGDGVGGVLGPMDYLVTTRVMLRSLDPAARRFPAEAPEIKVLWGYYGAARGLHRLRQAVDTNDWQSLTTVFLKNANFIDTAKLLDDLRVYEREQLRPNGMSLGFAGDVAVSQSLIKGIVTTQVQSLAWSLAGIYAVTALFGRSLRWGLYAVLPSALAVLFNFAVMGWFGIPLSVATSMFAGMTLGLGVDFAVHILEGYGSAAAAGASPAQALSKAMALTGPPVLINTVAISLGFGVLTLSQVPANAWLGLLVILGLVDCLITSLLILPVLLHWWPLRPAGE